MLGLSIWCLGGELFAGGGPENVMLVVNRRSASSMAIANHYRHLRKIPDANLFYIDWTGSLEAIYVDVFRDQILLPVLTAIENRKLSGQIDYIVYSSDFPYSVNFQDEVPTQAPDKFTYGSLTGLTYLAPLVINKTSYNGLQMNWYARRITPSGMQTNPTRGFRFETHWDSQGNTTGPDGMRYILSAMLGYTSGRGNSVDEVINYLDRSAAADHTYPQGTVYFSRNDDIRSKVRDSWYSLAVSELQRLGVRAEILEGTEGITPHNRDDVMGATMGKANLGWSAAGNTIQPGAICENFTSFGGKLAEYGTQTPLTDLLRYGAAGSTGAVVEPFALPDKFPNSFVHVHYARGCSLAEAVYQSVRGPYQMLLVGDPLCQPWAKPPQVHVDGLAANSAENPVSGNLKITPRVDGNVAAKHFEVFLEGRRVATVPLGQNYVLDTTQIPDGYHELRVVAVANDMIEAQDRQILPFYTKNFDRTITYQILPQDQQRWNQPIVIDAESPGAKGIAVYANRELISRSGGEKCRFVITPLELGMGPVQLQVIGLFAKQANLNIFSEPADVVVLPPEPIPALPSPVGLEYEEGIRLSTVLGAKILKDTSAQNWPTQAGITAGEPFTLEGLVQVPRDGVYQLQLSVDGQIKIHVGPQAIADMQNQRGVPSYALVPMTKGWHVFKADVKLDGAMRCSLKFGDAGCRFIGAPAFHVPS